MASICVVAALITGRTIFSSMDVRRTFTFQHRKLRRSLPVMKSLGDSHSMALSSRFSCWEESLDKFMVDVVALEAINLDVRLLAPFTIATTKLEVVQNVAFRAELRDGSVGWGEASTLPPVTAEDQFTVVQKGMEASRFLEALDEASLRTVLTGIAEVCPGHEYSSVRAGLQMAVVDAVAHSLRTPLWRFFGGSTSCVTTDITIPICSPEEAEELARTYSMQGFLTVKTKVGGRCISSDIALLKAIRRGHPSCSFILDANCGYSAEEALCVLKELRKEGILPCLFEQPVRRDDWDGLGQVSKIAKEVYGVPVAADESCRSVEDAKLIIARRLADVVNIKLVKMGLLESMEIIKVVKEAGLGLMIGGMVETRLAMGFSGHIAAGLGCFSFVDLDTPLLLADDPVQGGYRVNGSQYTFTNDFGNGCSLKASVGGRRSNL